MSDTDTGLLPAVVIEPKQPATAAIIWLHGLGADGNDFVPVVPQLELDDLAIRYIFPHAPSRPITINGGMTMPGWYDITSMDITTKEDQLGIEQSSTSIIDLIQHQLDNGIAAEKIILAGFSQGGAIALHTGVRHPKYIGGIMALSTYLPLKECFEKECSPDHSHLSIFMGHGTYDPVVAISAGERSRDYLQQHNYPVEWHDYPMEHSVCSQQLTDIGNWLRKLLG
jgi:phospholipase/carboxylesterase